MKECRVMVTGAGSGVGQGIIKALRLSQIPQRTISCDISPMSAGLYRTHESVLIPKVEEIDVADKLIDIILGKKIDVVMIGSEFDLYFFSQHKHEIENRTGAKIVVAEPSTISLANDKWLTTLFLKNNFLPFAEAHLPDSLEDALSKADSWGYPVMLKDRTGTASRHVHLIKDHFELLCHYSGVPMPMLQRVVDIPRKELATEYTCSVFKGDDGKIIGPFTARRSLRGGSSWEIEVYQFSELNEVIIKIASLLNFVGSLNVQLMIGPDGPIPFEINARFSGTTAVRAHFGFNEPEMAIRSFYFGEDLSTPIIRHGVCLRYLEEVFIENMKAKELNQTNHRGVVNRWF